MVCKKQTFSRHRPRLRGFLPFTLLLCALCIGCRAQKQDRVVFFVGGAPNELEAWESLVQDFEEISGISVEVLRQPADTAQQRQGLIVSLDAKLRDPDVFLMDVAWVGLFAHSGWLEPRTPGSLRRPGRPRKDAFLERIGRYLSPCPGQARRAVLPADLRHYPAMDQRDPRRKDRTA